MSSSAQISRNQSFQASGSASSSSPESARRFTPSPHADESDDDEQLEFLNHGIEESYPLRPLRSHEKSLEDQGDDVDHEGGTFLGRDRRTSSVQSFQLYTPDEERSVLRKLDRRVVGLMAVLYLLSFLDRSSMSLPALASRNLKWFDYNLYTGKNSNPFIYSLTVFCSTLSKFPILNFANLVFTET
jgi:hypothetical protein